MASKDDWVLKDKRNDVEGLTARRAKTMFVTIPPGAAASKAIPLSSLIHYMRRCKFQQGRGTTCLMDAFGSVMFDFGRLDQVLQSRKAAGCHAINQTSSMFWLDFGTLVNSHFNQIGL